LQYDRLFQQQLSFLLKNCKASLNRSVRLLARPVFTVCMIV